MHSLRSIVNPRHHHTPGVKELVSMQDNQMALDIELDTGAQQAAIFSEIVCPGPCKG